MGENQFIKSKEWLYKGREWNIFWACLCENLGDEI